MSSTESSSVSTLPSVDELKGKRIGIFGLSANPPTIAHRKIVAHLCSLRIFDEIWVLPVYQHIYDSKRNLETYEHRIAMCEISLTGSAGSGGISSHDTVVRISRLEKIVSDMNRSQQLPGGGSNSSGRIGTVDILEYVNAVYPNIQWNLVLGTDTYSDILQGKWKRVDSILQLAALHVFCRQNPSDMKLLSAPSHARVSLYQIPGLIEISSTNIRNKTPPILFGSFASLFSEEAYVRDITSSRYMDWVTDENLYPGVLEYIKARQLYYMSPEALIKRRRWLIVMLANIAVGVVYSRKQA